MKGLGENRLSKGKRAFLYAFIAVAHPALLAPGMSGRGAWPEPDAKSGLWRKGDK